MSAKWKKIERKIVSGMMAAGVAASPWAGGVAYADITTLDGTSVGFTDGVANIYAQDISANGSIGLNRFKDFDLNANQIANLYFNQKDGSITVNNLVNMVQNQINISGVVNAIRNNQIGGNLFFLSPKGMVVGASGVINTGSLTVMTPTDDFFKKAVYGYTTTVVKTTTVDKDNKSTDKTETTNTFLTTNLWDKGAKVSEFLGLNGEYLAQGQIASGFDDKNAPIAANIPINSSGTITINGTINAATAVKLEAAAVEIAKASGQTTMPLVQTGVKFDNIVNLGKKGQSVKASSEKLSFGIETTGEGEEAKTYLVLTDPTNATEEAKQSYIAKNTTNTATSIEKKEVVTETTPKAEAGKPSTTTKETVTTLTTTTTTTKTSEFVTTKGTDGTVNTAVTESNLPDISKVTPTKEEKTDAATGTKTVTNTKTVSVKGTVKDNTVTADGQVVKTEFKDQQSNIITGDGSITIAAQADKKNAKSGNKAYAIMNWFSYYDEDKIKTASDVTDFAKNLLGEKIAGSDKVKGILDKYVNPLDKIKALYEFYTAEANLIDTASASVKVGEGATINAIGNADISATAVATAGAGDADDAKSLGSQLALAKATVDISGKVTGADVNIKSKSEANIDSAEIAGLGDILFKNKKVTGLIDILPDKLKSSKAGEFAGKATDFINQMNMALGIMDSSATTNINKTADVSAVTRSIGEGEAAKSLGGNLTVDATSTASDVIKVKIAAKVNDKGESTNSVNWLNGGFVWEDINSNATVNVNGKTKSDAVTSITANAETTAELSLTMEKAEKKNKDSKNTSAYFNAGVSLLTVDNNAKVNINDTSDVTAGVLSIAANSKYSIDDAVKINVDERSVLNTAVNVIDVDTDATVNVNKNLTAGYINISSSNEATKYNLTADNAYEYVAPPKDTDSSGGSGSGGSGTDGSDTKKESKEVTIETEVGGKENDAKTTEKNKSATDALTDLTKGQGEKTEKDATSDSTKESTNKGESGKSGSGEQDSADKSKTETSVDKATWNQYFDLGAAVLVANIDKDSTVNVSPDVTLTSYDGANIIATSTVGSSEGSVKSTVVNGDKNTKVIVDAAVAVENFTNNATVNLSGFDGKTSTSSKHATINAGGAVNVLATSDWASGDKSELTVDASTKAAADQTGAKVSAAGSVAVQNIKNNATLNVKDYTAITSGGEVGLNSIATVNNGISVGELKDNSDSAVGVGGSVSISNIQSNALAKVNNGVNITGTSIDVNAVNSLTTTNKVMSGSVTTTAGVTGMVNYMSGESTAKALVDDGVTLTAKGQVPKEHEIDKAVVQEYIDSKLEEYKKAAAEAEEAYNNVDEKETDEKAEAKKTKDAADAKLKDWIDNKVSIKDDLDNEKNKATYEALIKEMGDDFVANKVAAITKFDSVNVTATNATTVTGLTGDISTSKAAAVGASVGIISYDVKSIAAITDQDGKASKGNINAASLKVETNQIGVINNLTVAGSTVDSAQGSGDKKDESKNVDTKMETTKDNNNKAANGDSGETMIELQDLVVSGAGLQDKDKAPTPTQDGNDEGNKPSNNAEEAGPSTQEENDKKSSKDSAVKLAAAGSVSYTSVGLETVSKVDNVNINLTKRDYEEDSKRTITIPDTNLSVTANDFTVIGSYSGAMARTKGAQMAKQEKADKDNAIENIKKIVDGKKPEDSKPQQLTDAEEKKATGNDTGSGESAFSGTLAGAVAINRVNKSTQSIINNSTVNNATNIINSATNSGLQLSAGLSLGMQTGKSSKASVNATGSVSVNLMDVNLAAKMNNNTVKSDNPAAVTNYAFDKDIQVAGGINANFVKANASLGAAVSINRITNNIAAEINGGTYGIAGKPTASITNMALSKLTQVGGAITIGVSTGDKTGAVINGAVAVDNITNTVNSNINGATIYANKVNVQAMDADVKSEGISLPYTAPSAANVDKEKGGMENIIDFKGQDAVDTINGKDEKGNLVLGDVKPKEDANGDIKANGKNKDSKIDYETTEFKPGNKGNTIVTASLAVAGKNGKGAAMAAGVSYAKVNNSFKSTLSNSNIVLNAAGADTTKYKAEDSAVNVEASSDTMMVGVGGGVAVSTGKYGAAAAGSVAIQGITNDTVATIQDTSIKAAKTNVKADTKSTLTTVAGQASFSMGNITAGMSWAQNTLNNTTGAYANGLLFDGITDSRNSSNIIAPSLALSADNFSKTWAIGAGAAATYQTTSPVSATAVGAYASNNGKNNTVAILQGGNKNSRSVIASGVKKAGNITATANDNTNLKALAGQFGLSIGTVTIGGSVANNNIGSATDKQSVIAKISNTDIYDEKNTTAENIKASVTNNASLLNIAAAGGAAAKFKGFSATAEGSVALSNIYTNTNAEISGVNIKGGASSKNDKAANVEAVATSSNNIKNISGGASVAGNAGPAIGAVGAISLVKSFEDTTANIKNLNAGTTAADLSKLNANATSTNKVMNVAGGASVAGSKGLTVTASANVATNKISNNTGALLDNVNAKAYGDMLVNAKSLEDLRNYGGALSVSGSAGVGVSVGATVVVNEISGDTYAKANNSKLIALGNSPDKNGLKVTADAKHTLKNISVTAGITGSALPAVSADATVAINKILGSTEASVNKSDVNAGYNGTNAGNVTVDAKDNTDISSHIGTMGVSISPAVGVSAAATVDNNTMDRKTVAKIAGESNTKRNALNAKNTTVNAKGESTILTSESGLSVGGGLVGVGATGVVSVDNYTGNTSAEVSNVNGNVASLDVKADSYKKINMYTNAGAVSGGKIAVAAAVAVTKLTDTSNTEAKLANSNITSVTTTNGNDGKISVNAVNDTTITGQTGALAMAFGIGGSANVGVSVDSIKNTVKTSVDNVKLGTDKAYLKSFEATANNNLNVNFTNANVGASFVTVGVGVGINKVNSGVGVSVNNSAVYARDITVNAVETRKSTQTGVAAGVGLGAVNTNVMRTSVGTAVTDNISYDNSSYSMAEINKKVNDGNATHNNLINNLSDTNKGKYTNDLVNKTDVTDTNGASDGSAVIKAAGVSTVVTNSTLSATNNVNVKADAATDVTSNVVQIAAGLGAVNVTVANADINSKVGNTIKNSNIAGNNVTINSNANDTMSAQIIQAASALGGVNVSVANVSHAGDNTTSVDGSSVSAANGDLNIAGNNNTKINSEFVASTAGVAAAGASNIKTVDTAKVDIKLGKEKANYLLKGNNINIAATNNPEIATRAFAAAVGLASGSGLVSEAKAAGSASVVTGDGNIFDTRKLTLTSLAGKDNTTPTAKSYVQAITGSGIGVSVNKARTINNMSSTVSVGTNTYANKNVDITVDASSVAKADSEVTSAAGGIIVSGNNFAQIHTANTVKAEFAGATSGNTEVGSLSVSARNGENVRGYAKSAGGGVISAGLAAAVELNDSGEKSDTIVNVSGNIKSSGDVNINAIHSDELKLKSDTLSVSILEATASKITGNVDNDTQLNIKNANITTTNENSKINIEAKNSKNLNKDRGEFDRIISGNGYGAVNVSIVGAYNTFNDKAAVNITNSKLNAGGALAVDALSDDNIYSHAYILTGSLLGGTGIVNNTTINNDNKVNIKNSTIHNEAADKDITISAADKLYMNTFAYSEMKAGAVNVVTASATNNVKRYNSIDITEGSTIYGNRDVNMYTDKLKDGNLAMLDMTTESTLYNGSIIPISVSPGLNNTIDQQNHIYIGSGSVSNSVRHTNMYADTGREYVNATSAKYTTYGSDVNNKLTMSDKQQTPDGKKTDNYVKVDGSVTAGVNNVVTIVIGRDLSKGQDIVMVVDMSDPNSKAAYEAFKNGVKDPNIKIVKDSEVEITIDSAPGSGITRDNFKFGVEDYATEMLTRYNNYRKLASEYRDDTDLRNKYNSEANRIGNLMVDAKLAHWERKGSEDVLVQDVQNVLVQFVELPKISASGGNITVDTEVLSGAGSLEAKGTPAINITNNTQLAMNLDKITMGEAGGKLIYNKDELSGTTTYALNKAITDKNKGKRNAGFSSVKVASGQDGSIKVLGNYSGVSFNMKAPDGTNVTYSPMSDIRITGSIYNPTGSVNVESKNDSIIIQGKNKTDDVSVQAKSISLIATKGSISQGYIDGIVNIGYDPKALYRGELDKAEKGQNYDPNAKNYDTVDGSKASDGTVWIAGKSVTIDAADININGIIQSGYGDFFVKIDDQAKTKIDNIKGGYGGGALSDTMVVNNSNYQIVKGGAIYNKDKGCYEYRLNAYYNPYTDTVLVEDVDAGGGRIYLNGRISNTGGGSIVCLDGVSDITVINDYNNNMKLGKLAVSDVSGRVEVTDNNTNTITVFTNGTKKEYDRKAAITAGGTDKIKPKATATFTKYDQSTLSPQSNLRYNWSEGFSYTAYQRFKRVEERKCWGKWSPSYTESDLARWESNAEKMDSTTGKDVSKLPGEVIGVGSSSNYFNVTHVHKEGQSTRVDEGTTKTSRGIYGSISVFTTQWRTETPKTDIYNVSLKADNAIPVKFIGQSAADGKISVLSGGNIELTGNVGNTNLYTADSGRIENGTVSIISANGSINQSGGSIYGNSINLAAAKNIKGIDITAGNTVNVSAINITDSSKKATGGSNVIELNIHKAYQAAGNVVLGNVGSSIDSTNNKLFTLNNKDYVAAVDNTSRITINAEGDISQKSGKYSFNFNTLTTNSNYSGGYSDGMHKYNKILGGTITLGTNAVAGSRIDLNAQGSIYGTSKSVALLLNAGQTPKQSSTLTASVNATANNDILLKQYSGDMRIGIINSKTGDVTLSVPNGSVYDALPYVETGSEDINKQLETWENLGIIKTDNNAAAIAEKGADYKPWDKNGLLYSLASSIKNPSAGNVPSNKAPNVVGKNITLEVKNSAGLNTGNTKRITLDNSLLDTNADGTMKRIDDLNAIMRADASTIKVESEKRNGKNVDVAVITELLPIGIQHTVDGGKLKITSANSGAANGNLYLQGRILKDAGNMAIYKNNNITLGLLNATGSVILESLGNIYGSNGNSAVIKAGELFLSAGVKGGSGSTIGTSSMALTTDIVGGTQLLATGDIFQKQVGSNTLKLSSVSSGGNINITAENDIEMLEDYDETGSSKGYIRTENANKNINITSEKGSVGKAKIVNGTVKRDMNNGLRFYNYNDGDNGLVTIKAAKDIYAMGVSDMQGNTPRGTLNIAIAGSKAGTNVQNASIYSNGKINLKSDKTILADNSVSLYSTLDVDVDGKISSKDVYVGSSKNVNVKAGAVSGTDVVKLEAAKGDVTVYASGKVVSANGKAELTAGNKVTNNGAVTAKTNATLNAKDVINNGTVTANDALLNAVNTVTNSSTVKASHNATLQGATVTNNGTVDGATKALVKGTKTAINNSTITSATEAELNGATATNNGTVNGAIKALVSGTNTAINNGTITSATEAVLSGAAATNSSRGLVTSTNTAKMTGTNVINEGNVTADKNAILDGTTVTNKAYVTSKANATVQGANVTNNGTVNGATKALVSGTNTAINNSTITSAIEAVLNGATATNNATVNGAIKALVNGTKTAINNGTITSATEAILNGAAATNSSRGLVTSTNTAKMTGTNVINEGNVTADKNAILDGTTVTNKAYVTSKANATVQGATVTNNGIVNGAIKALVNGTRTAINNAAITSAKEAVLNGATVTNNSTVNGVTKALVSGTTTALNNGIITSATEAVLDGATATNSNKGLVTSTNTAKMTGTNVINEGNVTADKNAILDGTTVTNKAYVTSKVNATVKGANVTNNGTVNGVTKALVSGTITALNNGTITSATEAVLDGATATNSSTGLVTSVNTAKMTGTNVINEGNVTADRNAILDGTNVTNKAYVTSKENATLKAVNSITNTGIINAISNNATLSAASITNSGTITAGNDAKVEAGNTVTNEATGKITANKKATVSGKTVTNKGIITAGTDASVTATNALTNSNTITAGNNATLTGGDITNSGTIKATNDATLKGGNIISSKEITGGNNVTLTGTDITNSGTIGATKNDVKLEASNTVTNEATGKITANKKATVSGKTVTNKGIITAGTDVAVTGTNTLTNSNTITGGNNATLIGGDITNRGTIKATNDATLKGGNIISSKEITGGNNVTLTGADITNSGTIKAANDATLKGSFIINSKEITGGNNVTLTGTDITNSGTIGATKNDVKLEANNSVTNEAAGKITANKKATVSGKTVTNKGIITAGTDASVIATNALTNSNTITGGNNATLNGGDITNSGTITATANNAVLTGKAITNGNVITAGNNATISGSAITNSGAVTARNNATVNGSAITNSGTITATVADATLKATDFITNTGVITAGNDTKIEASNTVTNEATGKITAKKNVTVSGKEVINKGIINADVDTFVTGTSILTNSNNITAGNDANLRGAEVNNSGIVNANNDVNVTSDYGINTGKILAENNVNVKITNSTDTKVESRFENKETGTVEAKKGNIGIDSERSVINAGIMKSDAGDVNIKAAKLIQNMATIEAAKDISLNGFNVVNIDILDPSEEVPAKDSSSIVLKAGNDLNINASNIFRSYGMANAGNDIKVNANVVDIWDTAKTEAAHDVNMLAKDNILNMGKINAGNDVLLKSETSDVYNIGDIHAKENIQLDAGGDIYNGLEIGIGEIDEKGTVLIEGKNVYMTARETIMNENAYILADENVNMVATGKADKSSGDIVNAGIIHSTGGTGNVLLKANGELVNAAEIINENGTITLNSDTKSVYNLKDATLIANNGNVVLESNASNKFISAVPSDTEEEYADVMDGIGFVKIPGTLDHKDLTNYHLVTNNNKNFESAGVVDNAGNIIAISNDENTGNIRLFSETGNVYNYDYFNIDDIKLLTGREAPVYGDITTGDITMSAANGLVYNDKNLYAGRNVFITGKKGLDSFGYDIYANKDINLHATGGDANNKSMLTSKEGNVNIIADKGNVFNMSGGDIVTTGGNVNLISHGETDGTIVGYWDRDGKPALVTEADPENGIFGYKNGTVINYGDIVAIDANASDDSKEVNGSITLKSDNADVYNFDDFNKFGDTKKNHIISITNDGTWKVVEGDLAGAKSYNVATSNINFEARKGLVYNDKKEVVGLGNVTWIAKDGMDSFGDTVFAGKNLTLVATEGDIINKAKLVSMDGDITLDAEKGAVLNTYTADVLALGGSVKMHAGGETDDKVYVMDITNIPTEAKALEGVSTNRVVVADRFYKVNGTGEVKHLGVKDRDEDTFVNDISKLNKAELESIYTVISYVGVDDEGKQVKTEIKTITAADTVSTYRLNGEDVKTGYVEVFHKGDVITSGDVVALGKPGKDMLDGKEVAKEKFGPNGSFDRFIGYDPDDYGNIIMVSDHANVTNYDHFDVMDGNDNYEVLGKNYFNQDTKWYKNKTLMMSTGSIGLTAPEGYFFNNYNIVTAGNLDLASKNDLVIGNGLLPIIAVGGDMSVKSVAGHVTNDAQGLFIGRDATLDGHTGVKNSSGLETGRSIYFYADEGNIEVDAGVVAKGEDIKGAKDENSMVKMWTNKGNVKADAPVIAAEGSIDIGSTNGDINLKEIVAKKMAAAGTKAGTVTVTKVNGEDVVFYSLGDNGTVKAEDVQVDKHLMLQSDNAVFDNIHKSDTADSKEYIDIIMSGKDGSTMKGMMFANIAGNAHFNSLNTTNAYVNVQNGLLAMDQLRVAGKGDFYAVGNSATVMGSNVRPTASEALYYDAGQGHGNSLNVSLDKMAFNRDKETARSGLDFINDGLGNTIHGPAEFNPNSRTWLNLYIDSNNYQRGNGLLLHSTRYHYVGNQRSSTEQLGGILTEFKPMQVYSSVYEDKLGMFVRYDLMDIPQAVVPVSGYQFNTLNSFAAEENSDDDTAENV